MVHAYLFHSIRLIPSVVGLSSNILLHFVIICSFLFDFYLNNYLCYLCVSLSVFRYLFFISSLFIRFLLFYSLLLLFSLAPFLQVLSFICFSQIFFPSLVHCYLLDDSSCCVFDTNKYQSDFQYNTTLYLIWFSYMFRSFYGPSLCCCIKLIK